MSDATAMTYDTERNTQLEKDRSNYLHALPNFLDCADWIQTLQTGNNTIPIQEWQVPLYQGQEISLKIPPSATLVSNFEHFYFENINHKRQAGTECIYVGYPILLSLMGNSLKSIPLFLFPIEFHSHPLQENTWNLKPVVNAKPICNPLLIDQLSLREEWSELIKTPLDKEGFNTILTHLGAEEQVDEFNWQTFPESKNWDLNEGEFKLYPSAIIGIFPAPERLSSFESSEDQHKALDAGVRWRHHFGHLSLDPSQRAAINETYNHPVVSISGKAGMGKKHVCKFLTVNALANGKKVLLISSNRSSIQNVQAEMEQLGIAHLGFWLQQPETDASLLINFLRAPKNEQLDQLTTPLYLKRLDQLQQIKDKFDASYRSVRRKIFGPFNWSQTVGLYLKSQSKTGKELLSAHILNPAFSFEIEEFSAFSQMLATGQPLFEQIGTIRHPLRNLKKDIFITLPVEEARHFILSKLAFFTKHFTQLQQDHVKVINAYAQELQDYFEQHYQSYIDQIENIQTNIQNNITAYGNDFLLTSETSLKLYRPFSERIRNINEERKKIKSAFHKLVADFVPLPEWDHEIGDAERIKSMTGIQQFLAQFQEQLNAWYEEIGTFLDQSTRRLNHQTALPELHLENKILNLEAALDQTIQELNSIGLLDELIDQPMLTLPKRQMKIESIIDLLENIKINMRDFDVFYNWQSFWLKQGKSKQELISAIIRVKPDSWVASFESWYLLQLLMQKQVSNLPQQDAVKGDFLQQLSMVKDGLITYIRHQWQKRKEEANKRLKRYLKSWEFNNLSSTDLFATEIDAISDHFPLFYSSPVNASRAFHKLQNTHFDLIIFESAQFVETPLGLHLKKLGKQIAVVGDDSFISDDGKADLHEYYLKNAVPHQQLYFSHRYYPAHLWQLIRGKSITETAIKPFEIQIYPLTATYQEAEKVNTEEANFILKLLLDLKKTPQRTYPSIAIVCNTIQQRNLISAKVMRLRKDLQSEESRILQQMERNGLSILHLEELEGQRFDTLIFSGTFGRNESGDLSPHTAFLNTPTGIRQLSELMAIGKSNLFIIHSFPELFLNKWMIQAETVGYFLLANYIRMAKAIKEGASSAQQSVIKNLLDWQGNIDTDKLSTPFYDELASRIAPYLSNYDIEQNYQSAHIEFPLIMRKKGQSKRIIAVIADGFLAEQAYSDLEWEIEKRKELAKKHIHILPVWSINWWKHPEQACRKLAHDIQELWAEIE